MGLFVQADDILREIIWPVSIQLPSSWSYLGPGKWAIDARTIIKSFLYVYLLWYADWYESLFPQYMPILWISRARVLWLTYTYMYAIYSLQSCFACPDRSVARRNRSSEQEYWSKTPILYKNRTSPLYRWTPMHRQCFLGSKYMARPRLIFTYITLTTYNHASLSNHWNKYRSRFCFPTRCFPPAELPGPAYLTSTKKFGSDQSWVWIRWNNWELLGTLSHFVHHSKSSSNVSVLSSQILIPYQHFFH